MSEIITATPPSPDISEEELQKKLQLQVVDVSDAVQANAVDSAEEYLSQQTTEPGVTGFLKKVWHGNIARDYYRQREIQRGRQEIVETGNIYALEDAPQAEHDRAMVAVVERFTDDFIHEGENNQAFEDAEHGQEFQGQLRELISSYARGDMDYGSVVEERTRILAEFGQHVHQQDRQRGLVYADNVLEVATNARSAFEHGLGLDRLEAAIGGRLGKARTGTRTEVRLQMTDRILDRMHQTQVGSLVNETTLALGLATGLTLAKWTTRKAISATTAAVSFGVGAGLIAGAREHLRVGQERTIHMRQMAEGGQIEAESPARQQMEGARYETASASLMTEQMQSLREALESGDESSLQNLIATATGARARIYASDVRSIDLVDYSSKTAVESERLALDIELAHSRVAIRRALEASGTEMDLENLQHTIDHQIAEDISIKDRVFKSLRRQRVAKMAAIGFITGETFGLAFQELHSLTDDGLRGAFESSGSDNDRSSLLGGWIHGDSQHGEGELHREFYDAGHHWNAVGVDLPEGYHLVKALDATHHSWEIRGPNGKNVLDGMNWDKWHDILGNDHNPNHFHHISQGHTQVGFDRQGNLDWESRQALKLQGWKIGQHEHYFNRPHLVEHSITRSPHEYLQHHLHDFTKVHRELWYDNNTPGVYDQNELKLWWGGPNQTGIDEHGNYIFNVSHMTADGSYHDGLSTNAQELVRDHKMALALSMTKDTQHWVKLIPIDAHGNALIPHNSFEAKALFENHGGHARFIGAYAEAVQLMGRTSDGGEATRMLATVVGDNHAHSAPDVVRTMVSERTHHYIDYLQPPEGLPVEVPPVLPIYSRRGLEALRRGPEAYGYYGYMGAERLRQWEAERSPRLRRNPDADLNTGEELSWYRNQIRRRRGKDYLSDVDRYIENDEVLASIGSEIKALVCMPVAAASESDNIYKTLSLYHQQSEAAKKETTIVLNVNWPVKLESDPAQKAKIEKTRAEIARAKADFPDLKIAIFEKQWTDDFISRRHGKIYGEVIKILYDTASLSVEKAISEGRRSAEQEAILITNDADAQGLRNNYLGRYIESMESDPSVDVFTGMIRWGTKEYRAFPGYGVANGFYAMLNMMQQRGQNRKSSGVSTTGPNAGFRLSAYAAIGGCEDRQDLGAGADAILGQRVVAARLAPVRPERGGIYGYSSSYGLGRRQADRRTRGTPASARKVMEHVIGAQVDTAADRLLGAYRRGEWIASGWYGFDRGSYEDRTVSAAAGTLERENVSRDINDITSRVEASVVGFASNWFPNPAVVSSALALYFGTEDKGGRPLYKSSWAGGRFQFHFTDEGKTYLKNRLLRDQRGHFDPFGSRIRRQLYSEANPGAAKQPKVATPRFVSHTV